MFYTAKIQNWKQFTTSDVVITSSLGCVLHCKDTKLKAIHNFDEIGEDVANVVFYTAKIQNWKQFTTELSTAMSSRMLCFTLQRYKIESNSQPHCSLVEKKLVVFYTAKIQNWKQFTTN